MIGQSLDAHAGDAYNAIRQINHATIWRPEIPAPEIYPVLGTLRQAAYGLNQTCTQLARGLRGSLSAYDVYDNNREPVISVTTAEQHLSAAAYLAVQLAEHLDQAQSAINSQGHHGPLANARDTHGHGGDD